MFPMTDINILIRAIKSRDVPVLDIVRALANVMLYAEQQLRGGPVVMMASAKPLDSDELVVELQRACDCHAEAVEARKIDWMSIMAALVKLIPLLF